MGNPEIVRPAFPQEVVRLAWVAAGRLDLFLNRVAVSLSLSALRRG